ncbi:hypothetical protein K1X76_06565 [bacterium]|nr:hypothetical protein [bacterium]
MTQFLCQSYWYNDFIHYYLFGFIGPLLAVICIWLLHKVISKNFLKFSLLIYFLINFGSCVASARLNIDCQILMFGYVCDDPGDIGVVALTLPLFVISFFLGIVAISFLSKKITRLIQEQ